MQFAFLVNVLNMLADLLLSGLKQLGHQWLRQPHSLILQADIQFYLSIVTLIDQQFTFKRVLSPLFMTNSLRTIVFRQQGTRKHQGSTIPV